MFVSVFRVLHLKTAVLRFWGLPRFVVFSNLVFGFRFLSAMMAVFRFFCPVHFTVFLVLPRK